jgi:DNA mismatch repair ATPase MutS
MIYPYPKEISFSGIIEDKILNCELLSVSQNDDICLIDHKPGKDVAELIYERDKLSTELESLMQAKLGEINRELVSFYGSFADYYERRKKRTWMYAVLFVKKENSLTLPVFQDSVGCTIENGYAYSLLVRKKEKCMPLGISLDRGSNVLYGANMSGKTTVLKTVYFLLTAIKAGLPVPADSIVLNYPEHVALMLKSSGDMNRDLSSFGEEINFFTGKTPDGSYILSDELFLSTDPVNGAELSEIFIKEFSEKELVFFCTTHYSQTLDIEGISLFRMLDPELNGISNKSAALKS